MIVLSWLWARIEAQPVAFGSLCRGAMLIGISFGLKLTMTQLGLIYPWIELLIAFLTWGAVTPNKTADEREQAALNSAPPGFELTPTSQLPQPQTSGVQT